jgi:hypothetical protein
MLTIPNEMVPLQMARGVLARSAIPDIDGIIIRAGQAVDLEFDG